MNDHALVCRDTTWLVSESRERTLTDAETAALAAHIRICPMCKCASQQFELLFRGLDALLRSEPASVNVPAERRDD